MLISNAYAQAAGAAQDPTGGLMGLMPIILMFIVLWFLMIRPQMKKAKEHQKMVGELQKGDEVVTQGGMAGRIVKVGENYVTLELDVKVIGNDRDGGLRLSRKGFHNDEERRAVHDYRREAASKGFGTFGDLLRTTLQK